MLYISKLIDRISTHTNTHTHTYMYAHAHKNSQPAAWQWEDRKGVGGHSVVGGLWRRGRLYTTTSRWRRGGITRGVLHYRGRDGIPGDMGRGFARRRPFDFDFETIMRGLGGRGVVKRRQWWHRTTGGVTEHTKMADTLGSFVRPGDNLTLKPPPSTVRRRRLSHHPPHTHAHRTPPRCIKLTFPNAAVHIVGTLSTTATSLSIRRVSSKRMWRRRSENLCSPRWSAECAWKRFPSHGECIPHVYIHI